MATNNNSLHTSSENYTQYQKRCRVLYEFVTEKKQHVITQITNPRTKFVEETDLLYVARALTSPFSLIGPISSTSSTCTGTLVLNDCFSCVFMDLIFATRYACLPLCAYVLAAL